MKSWPHCACFYADMLQKLFTDVKYSQKGSSVRIREETAFMYLVDYFDDCERGIYTYSIDYVFNTALGSC